MVPAVRQSVIRVLEQSNKSDSVFNYLLQRMSLAVRNHTNVCEIKAVLHKHITGAVLNVSAQCPSHTAGLITKTHSILGICGAVGPGWGWT